MQRRWPQKSSFHHYFSIHGGYWFMQETYNPVHGCYIIILDKNCTNYLWLNYNSFPSLLPLVTPESTAKEIISAVKKNLLERSIPSPLLVINNIFRFILNSFPFVYQFSHCVICCRCYPYKMALDFKDFMGGGVDTHDD